MTAPQDTPLTVNPAPEQVDTPLTVTPSPLNMPGAKQSMNSSVESMTAPKSMAVSPQQSETKKPEGDTLTNEELMAKYKGVQELARKFEKTAKDEHDDAERYRQLQKQFSGNGDTAPDPIAEVTRLRQEIESERTERVRERIARETGVPPSQVYGTDEASMKDAAEQALAWAKGLQQSSNMPAVAPAATVNSTTPTHQTGVQQIRSRDELKHMSSSEVMDAYNNGRMDSLLGKTPQ